VAISKGIQHSAIAFSPDALCPYSTAAEHSPPRKQALVGMTPQGLKPRISKQLSFAGLKALTPPLESGGFHGCFESFWSSHTNSKARSNTNLISTNEFVPWYKAQ